jgi:MFS transporter, DHA1 family, multidrug resistance protein
MREIVNKFSEKQKKCILLIVLMITPLPQLLIDMYLPALPGIQAFFSTTASAAQLSMPVYLVTYSISMVIFGISSDIYGRKSSFIVGLSICFIGVAISSFSTSIVMFLVGRGIQGLGVGAAAAIIIPVLIDVFDGKRLIHAILYTNVAYGVAPIVAPYLGGVVLLFSSWQGIFILLLIYAFIVLIIIKCFLPETHVNYSGNLSLRHILSNTKRIFSSLDYLILLLVISCPWGFVIAFNIDGPFIFQQVFHLSPYKYGEVTLMLGCANVLGVFIARFLLKRITPEKLISLGVIYYIIVAIAFFVLVMFSFKSMYLIVLFSFLLSVTSGFVFGSIISIALQPFADISGLAAAIFLSLTNLIWALISYVLSYISCSLFNLSTTALVLSVLGCIFWGYYLHRNRVINKSKTVESI